MKPAEFGNATLHSHQKDQHLSLQFDLFLKNFLWVLEPLSVASDRPSSLFSLKLINLFFTFTSTASMFPFLFTDKLHS